VEFSDEFHVPVDVDTACATLLDVVGLVWWWRRR
jgi:hypothetical protein